MTGEHGTLQAFTAFMAIWSTTFFGVWTLPIDDSLKINLDIFITISVSIFAFSYFLYKGIIRIREELVDKIIFWLRITSTSLTAGIMFVISYVTWEIVTIEGVNVVTYNNLRSLYFGILGVIMVIFTLWYAINRNPYEKTEKKENE